MQLAAPGLQGQLVGIGSTPLQLTGWVFPLTTGVTVRALAANSTSKVYVGQQNATPIQIAASTAWAINTVYAKGAIVSNGGALYTCTTAGTSAGSGGPLGTAPSITDNSVVWAYLATQTVSSSNGYELSSGESHLFQQPNASLLYVMAPTGTLAVCFDAA